MNIPALEAGVAHLFRGFVKRGRARIFGRHSVNFVAGRRSHVALLSAGCDGVMSLGGAMMRIGLRQDDLHFRHRDHRQEANEEQEERSENPERADEGPDIHPGRIEQCPRTTAGNRGASRRR